MKECPPNTAFKSAFADFLTKLDYSDLAVITRSLNDQWHKLYMVEEKSIASQTLWALRSCCDVALYKKQHLDADDYYAEPVAEVAQA